MCSSDLFPSHDNEQIDRLEVWYNIVEEESKTVSCPWTQSFTYSVSRTKSLEKKIFQSMLLTLMLATLFGRRIIDYLQKQQIGETIRDLGLEGQMSKKGTPTMGGVIIIMAILIPILLFSDLTNIYIILIIVTTVWLGLIGFLDDYIKVFRKNKEGLSGKFKIVGQVGLVVS